MQKRFAVAQLRCMGYSPCVSLAAIQKKKSTGVSVWRVRVGRESFVLKHFLQPEARCEIAYYHLLAAHGVPTLHVLAETEEALLLEDMANPDCPWRLGTDDDLRNPIVAQQLAAWYRALHKAGRTLAQTQTLGGENDCLTRENLRALAENTGTAAAPVWSVLDANLARVQAILRTLPRTLTYNDFDAPNLAVARDGSAALVFDYDNLRTGYVYADIRNVCYCLDDAAKAAFLAAYGVFGAAERVIDEAIAPLVVLHHACGRKNFPAWAEPDVERVLNGDLLWALRRVLG
jgi:hypothetical protein